MVRDDVEDLPHLAILQRGGEGAIILFGADFRVQLSGVGDVVAVKTAGRGFEIGGGVTVRDAQRVQIRNNRARVLKCKRSIKLHAISCDRHTCAHKSPVTLMECRVLIQRRSVRRMPLREYDEAGAAHVKPFAVGCDIESDCRSLWNVIKPIHDHAT